MQSIQATAKTKKLCLIPVLIAAVSRGPLRLIHGSTTAGRVRVLGVHPDLTNLLPAGGVYSFTYKVHTGLPAAPHTYNSWRTLQPTSPGFCKGGLNGLGLIPLGPC
ncbi:hypothetical protein ATANTOWER_023064 [Ataeniobius toweri]|uniref:Uncharacterized protein n=1 Tax=Ataeniobius toweri TaxID=208326 RepID=A0ABU7BND3_9TELE|nr:hypothetical protein [Ataeniobius toweri]